MKFRTEYKVSKKIINLQPGLPVVLLGSCFSQNISGKMREHGWEAVNPASTLYNPSSIAKAIELMLSGDKGREIFEDSLFEFSGIWHSKYFDSTFSSRNRTDSIEEFIMRQKQFLTKLNAGQQLIVTFGTSICYHDVESREAVGNCHKQPSVKFYRRRMKIEEIVGLWSEIIEELNERFPELKLIFTVSPVRHLKEGFEGNSRSKAVLQLCVEEICEKYPQCGYFPAYEILNDDLRDYRFYAEDLVHPSAEAIEYIWEKFIETYVESEGLRILEEGAKKIKAVSHRPHLGALGKPLL